MSMGFAVAHAEIARTRLSHDSAERIVAIVARTLPENADRVIYWERILECVQEELDAARKSANKRGKK